MTRAEALKALDAAIAQGIERMVSLLKDGFAGSSSQLAAAKERFEAGVDQYAALDQYARKILSDKFGD